MYKNRINALEQRYEELISEPSYIELVDSDVIKKKALEIRVQKAYDVLVLVKELKIKQKIFDSLRR